MEQYKKKYLYLISLLTSSFSQKAIAFLLFGLILVGFGVFIFKIDRFISGDEVEVLNNVTESPNISLEIVVEIAGAVEKPGVYKMQKGARVNDLLISADGISAGADRVWMEKNINKASMLVDGQKIYIYHLGEASAKDSDNIKLDHSVLGDVNINNSNLTNVNTASQSELEKLKGIGPVFAKNIIEHRPYSDLKELVSKGAIGQKVLEKIINEISLY